MMGPGSLCLAAAVVVTPCRHLATLKTRTMQLFETPIEFQMYQRFTNNPTRFSGPQFNTHFTSHHRKYDKTALVDYLNWGRTLGQPHMVQRYQRVAFDFNDTMHPTKLPDAFSPNASSAGAATVWSAAATAIGGAGSEEKGRGANGHDVSAQFNPNSTPFNFAVHYNRFFSVAGFPLDGRIELPKDYWNNYGPPGGYLTRNFITATDTVSKKQFGNADFEEDLTSFPLTTSEIVIRNHGAWNATVLVPGIHRPFYGERDRMMMLSMARSYYQVGKAKSLCYNKGRWSRSVYINRPARANSLATAEEFRALSNLLDESLQGLRSKVVVFTAAQCGLTDFFSSGIDLETLAALAESAAFHARECARLQALPLKGAGNVLKERRAAAVREHEARAMASSHTLDDLLRAANAAIWRCFTATKPLITLINGKCRNVGNGLALLSKFPGLRDSSEFAHEGPQWGMTPFGGMTHLLARDETTLKYPGLAEFVMLTGFPLYSGDALRLGWSDLFSTLPDLDYHIRAWFEDSEHLHVDAVTWQIGQLLDTCFKPGASSNPTATKMERVAVTERRAQWIEDCFADQRSVDDIVTTLTQVEQLPLTDPNNHADVNLSQRASLADVAAGVEKLKRTKMHFSLTPWDITAPSEVLPVRQVSEVFQEYFWERKRQNTAPRSVNRNKAAVVRWQKHRQQEYSDFKKQVQRACPRHVFARLEGSEGTLADFEYSFDRNAAYREYQRKAANGGDHQTPQTKGLSLKKNNSDAAIVDAGTKTGGGETEGGEKEGGALVLVQNAAPPIDAFSFELETRTVLLDDLKRHVLRHLGQPESRAVKILWYLPTFDTAPVRCDAELLELLHADPGVEDAMCPTKRPPIYFLVSRDDLHFSEWAYSVKHHLLLQSPFALKASMHLLRCVRGDDDPSENSGGGASSTSPPSSKRTTTTTVKNVAETLSLEFRFAMRSVLRPDFHRIGIRANRAADDWERAKQAQRSLLNEAMATTTSNAEGPDETSSSSALLTPETSAHQRARAPSELTFDSVFERDVTIDGHYFALRPRWQPRLLSQVSEREVESLSQPLGGEPAPKFVPFTELDVSLEADSRDHVEAAVNDFVGFEVVPRLGEKDDKGKSYVDPAVSSATVPTNVNFYEQARHPWAETPNSWRYDGYTENSLRYFRQKYEEAAQATYDPERTGAHNYWPTTAQPANTASARGGGSGPNTATADSSDATEQVKLKDRFWNVIEKTEKDHVEQWARASRDSAKAQKFPYLLDVPSTEEKVFDDHYYRWFITPGEHPNPSGIIRGAGGGGGSTAAASPPS